MKNRITLSKFKDKFKVNGLHTKQNGSHDLNPTLKNDSRSQTIIGNSGGDTDKSADKNQGFSNNKPVVSPDNFNSMIKNLEVEIKKIRDEILSRKQVSELFDEKMIEGIILEAKLETAKQLKEIVEKAIDEFNFLNFCNFHFEKFADEECKKELREALGVET